MKFFGSSKNKKNYNKLESTALKQEEIHFEEDPSLKQINAELKHLKKQRKKLTPPNLSQVCAGAFYMGVPAFPSFYYASSQNINSREIKSLDNQIDRLEEIKYKMMHPTLSPK